MRHPSSPMYLEISHICYKHFSLFRADVCGYLSSERSIILSLWQFPGFKVNPTLAHSRISATLHARPSMQAGPDITHIVLLQGQDQYQMTLRSWQ